MRKRNEREMTRLYNRVQRGENGKGGEKRSGKRKKDEMVVSGRI